MKKSLVPLIYALSFTSISCGEENSAVQNVARINPPGQTEDGWQTGNLRSAGIDSQKLQIMVDKIADGAYQNIHSVLIIKQGVLVFEHYFPGWKFNYEAKDFKGERTNFTPNSIHNLASVTKSITSILFGIAADQGFIDSVDEKLFKFFPEYAFLSDSMKSHITLQHLLTMTSGLQWNEQDVFYREAKNDIIQLFIVPDPVKYILAKPAIHRPGTEFYYNGGNTNLLGEVIQETSRLRLDAFAKKYLFEPLGIEQYKWIYINDDMVYASGDLKLRPRDMAKIGYLMLKDGVWKSRQIVSSVWVEKSISPSVRFNASEGYGYQWWIKKYALGAVVIPSFAAMGWGGQNIIVLPDLDAVLVLTAGNYATESPNNEIIYRYILPALQENFRDEYDEINNEAPILTTFEISKPADTVSGSIARLSGHWYGRGDFSIADQLVVEKIDSTAASVLYSWGKHPGGYFDSGWVRTAAQVDRDGRIKFSLDSAALTFELDKHEDVLIGYYEKGGARSKLIMRRR